MGDEKVSGLVSAFGIDHAPELIVPTIKDRMINPIHIRVITFILSELLSTFFSLILPILPRGDAPAVTGHSAVRAHRAVLAAVAQLVVAVLFSFERKEVLKAAWVSLKRRERPVEQVRVHWVGARPPAMVLE